MATSYTRSFSTFGFDVFNFVPQGHEKALKQAFYNTVAILFVVFVSFAGVAVYFVLEPFLRPLLWAVLFGSVLHPFKRSLTVILKSWLHGLHETGTPLALGVLALPFGIIDRTSEFIGCFFLQYITVILSVSAGLPAVYILYSFLPQSTFLNLCNSLNIVLTGVSAVLEFFHGASYLVWTAVVGYLLLLKLWWTPQSQSILIKISPLVWIAIICHLVTVAGSLRLTILLLLIALMIIGFIAEIKGKQSEVNEPSQRRRFSAVHSMFSRFSWLTGGFQGSHSIYSEDPHLVARIQDISGNDDPIEFVSHDSSDKTLPCESASRISTNTSTSHESVEKCASISSSTSVPQHTSLKKTISSVSASTETSNNAKSKECPEEEEVQMSNMYLYGLLWGCIMAEIWLHLWLLHLLPIPIVYIIAKRCAYHFGLWSFIKTSAQDIWANCREWFEERRNALVPSPIRGLWKLMVQGDRMVIAILESSIDTFTSTAVILLLFILAVVGTIFIAVQIYGESMHLVGVTSSLINSTLVYNSEIQQLLPESLLDIQGALDTMLGDAYIYGREWIIATVRRIIDEKDDVRAAALEKQLLEVWDRVYNLWVSRNTTEYSSDQPSSASFDTLMDGLKTLNLDLVLNFVKENIGTFMSVLDSIWMVLKGNISLALSALTAVLSLVFGGGTALMNFILSFIVFSTSLFYILCASGDQYKPVELFTSLLPSDSGSVTKFGVAVEEAVNGIFAASFKMTAFYGLYTWLIHTLFDVKIVYIPSVLAAVFGAVPFLGPYWACLPAVLELWLVNGQILKAGIMLACQLVPTSFVDTAIYSEIKSGGHPYLTGLAIAGGVFCLGFEGALFGPMLLCVLFVAMNMYSAMMQESSLGDGKKTSRFPLKRSNSQ